MRARLLVALLGVATVLPASAGMFDDDEARRRIEELRAETAARMDRIEAASRSNLELARQLDQLREELARLRGQIEVLTNEMESTQKRQRDFYVDLDTRMRKLETAAAAAAEAKPAAPAVDPAAEARDYEAALNLFKGGKYREALAAFQGFIKAYPTSQFAPSAHYWSGSAHYQLGEYKHAIEMFSKVPTAWPTDPKAPDALLGVANCQQETGDAKGARATLTSLTEKYPGSAAAQVAKQRLTPVATPKKRR